MISVNQFLGIKQPRRVQILYSPPCWMGKAEYEFYLANLVEKLNNEVSNGIIFHPHQGTLL